MDNSKVVDKSGWNYTIVDNHIVETENLNIYQKMLYIALKRFANIQTSQAFPGVGKLAVMAGMSHRKARQVIGELIKKEYIKVEYRKNKTSLYTILPPPALHSSGEARDAGGVRHAVHDTQAQHASELKKEELKRIEQQKDNYKDNVAKAPALPFETIINYLNEKTGKSYRSASKKTQALITARFNDGFTVEEFKTVIDTKTEEWLEDSKFQVYLQPSTLFGTKFENYLNQKPKGGPPNGSSKQGGRKSGPSEWDDIRI